MDAILASPVSGIIISVLSYSAGLFICEKLRFRLLNPQVIGIALVMLLLAYTPLTIEQYSAGGSIIALFVLPATIVLALKIFKQWNTLKAAFLPVIIGAAAGAAASVACTWFLCRLFRISDTLTASLLPKSVTTAIALGLSAQSGGIPSITLAAVIITGNTSAIFSPLFLKLFRMNDPVATGVAMGVSGHAIGTAGALEIGELEGAVSGVSLVLAGIMTSILFVFF
jgi:putative effector of murein hydrolase